MTCVIHHGPPGSFKSFAIVQNVVIPALKAGRTVVSNIRGLDNIDKISEVMGIDIPDGTKLINVPQRNADDFKKMAVFHHWAPTGALIVIDEAQAVYPTSLRSLSVFNVPEGQERSFGNEGETLPTQVERAFDMHRHYNWDIYVSTPNIAKIHKEIRLVVEYAYRHRDMTGLLPWKKNEWREFKHDAEQSGKSVSHYIGAPVVRKADVRVFECYKSTATGKAKGSNENKNIFNDPKLRIYLSIMFLALCGFIYTMYGAVQRYSARINPVDEADTQVSSQIVSVTRSSDTVRVTDPHVSPLDYQLVIPLQTLLQGRTLYYTGSFFGEHYFTAIGRDDDLQFSGDDFEASGYQINILSACVVSLVARNSAFYATCAPDTVEDTQRLADTSLEPSFMKSDR
jgi:zona occludens toxin